MPLTTDQLRSIPMLAGLTDAQLDELAAIFERLSLRAGERLCSAGDPARELYLLARGEVALADGDRVRFELRPPAPIGELGALGGLLRNVDVTVTQDAEVWRVSREALMSFLRAHADLAITFYQNLTEIVADKVRRDQVRLDDMRANLIRTQKEMKALREFLLESEDTAVSERVHDALDRLIDNNRRINYRVAPPRPLPVGLRLDRGTAGAVLEISRTHFSYQHAGGEAPAQGGRVSGVLALAGPEIPVSGKVIRSSERRVTLELDGLIPEYAAALEGYLSRVQMLDFVV